MVGPAQPGHTLTGFLIPIRHRAMGIVHRISVPTDSDMDTWEHCPPNRLGPPSVPRKPSVHSSNTSQVGREHFRSTHIHSTRQGPAQIGDFLGHGRGQSPSSIAFPTPSLGWAETKAL
eukprot:5537498-Amphidinium_carterae.1